MDYLEASFWHSFLTTEVQTPTYVTSLAERLGCSPTVPSVIETLKLIVEAGR
jgi:hypothetical protein